MRYIFIAVLKKTLVKVTWILFTNFKCNFLANPTNWLNIIKPTTVFENEYKVEMHFKQSEKTPPLAIKLNIHNLIINEIYFIYKLIREKSNFKNREQTWNVRIQISLCFFLTGSCLTPEEAGRFSTIAWLVYFRELWLVPLDPSIKYLTIRLQILSDTSNH